MEWIVEAETLEDLIDGKVLKQQEHIYVASYIHSITVMLNADGTPVTAEQLGIDY